MAEKEMLRALFVEPHKPPVEIEFEHTLEAQQKLVEGLIDYLYDDEHDAVIVINDEGKLLGMEGNRRIEGDVLVGPFFVVGSTEDDICSLTDEQMDYYKERFAEPEEISREEINQHMGYKIVSFESF